MYLTQKKAATGNRGTKNTWDMENIKIIHISLMLPVIILNKMYLNFYIYLQLPWEEHLPSENLSSREWYWCKFRWASIAIFYILVPIYKPLQKKKKRLNRFLISSCYKYILCLSQGFFFSHFLCELFCSYVFSYNV